MILHRALVRGDGFYDWMSHTVPDINQAMRGMTLGATTAGFRKLPVINLCSISDSQMRALFAEIVPQDRERLRVYLEQRVLGHGYVTAVS
jgi:hypothetical protein